MSRRSGQSGHIEKRGNAFYVRFWVDVLGQEKRKLACVRICPASGPGTLSKSERKRRAREIIAESGVDSAEYFRTVVLANRGTTFRQQSEWWIDHIQKRKRRPIKPATALSWKNCLAKWLNPSIGDLPLCDVNNSTVKALVSKMAEAGLSAKSIDNYVKIVKMVVASALDEHGEEIYPRKWNHEFLDMPEIRNQHTPSLTAAQITQILELANRPYRVLYGLLAGSGLRIGEALGLEIGHVSEDGSTVSISQSVWNGKVQSPKTHNAYRQVDLAPALASLLREHIGSRTSGFVFEGRNGRPIGSQSSILKRSLHPILREAGFGRCGFHAFRRFRNTYLRNYTACPYGLRNYWLGWSGEDMSDHYDKIREDESFRREVAKSVGLGFEIPIVESSICSNDTKNDAVEQFA